MTIINYLPSSGENKFQKIKEIKRIYISKYWEWSEINVGVGEPDTLPPQELRKAQAQAKLSDNLAVHTYQDNGEPSGLSSKLVKLHTEIDVADYPHLKTLPIPWIKPMIGQLIDATGAGRREISDENGTPIPNDGYMKTAPAYDVSDWASQRRWEKSLTLPLYSYEDFRLNVKNLPENELPRLILTVKPWNPCPVGATREEWEEIIEFCIEHSIRLVNDGAYSGLVHQQHTSLTEIAKDYPELERGELFSISKTFSDCWWRVGALVGSANFVDEVAKTKGNTDSGFNGAEAYGLNDYLDTPQSKEDVKEIQKMYKDRLVKLFLVFEKAGLKRACETDAGFFMLFHAPDTLNGESVKNAEDFNMKMIEQTGIIGVPFDWSEVEGETEQFIRYSACYNVLKEENLKRLQDALGKVTLGYMTFNEYLNTLPPLQDWNVEIALPNGDIYLVKNEPWKQGSLRILQNHLWDETEIDTSLQLSQFKEHFTERKKNPDTHPTISLLERYNKEWGMMRRM